LLAIHDETRQIEGESSKCSRIPRTYHPNKQHIKTLVDAGKWLAMSPENTALMTLHAKIDRLVLCHGPQKNKIKK